jgi:hypothetical protein
MHAPLCHLRWPLVIAFLFAATPAPAQTDEIQVYDANIAAPGKFNLTLHDNYTPSGLEIGEFHGAIISDKSFNGVPEWAYGVTDWFETGVYLPLYSISKNRGATLDGFKLRALLVSPHAADRFFFYGVNFELSFNARDWDASRVSSEVRPIIGWHFHPIDVIVNPIIDTDYNGFGNLVFAPETRVAWNLSPTWATGVEEYSELGRVTHLTGGKDAAHQIYWVVDHQTKLVNIEFGIGFGLTDASDKLTLKLILSRDLN